MTQHIHLSDIEWKEPVSGFKVRFIHSENMTFAFWDIAAGASLPEHAHPHEQVSTLFEGEFELTVDGETHKMAPGSVLIVPSNAVHAGKAVINCRIMDVFYPIREDYR
jgi:quercetin dioxygenase-like cupin family protein